MFKEIINFQKVIQFIKYHNAFTIGLVLVFIFGASVFASDTIREATIGKPVIEKAGVDNTALLGADLDNFDFTMQINNVTEDKENYYVLYTYQTLDIQSDVWQPVSRQETLEVSKSALADRDLGLYVAEELGEIIDSQKAYLVKVQQKQKEKGITLIQETTKYTGLIGMVLNPKTKELPGYEPVVKPAEPVAVVYTEPAPSESGSPSALCNPAWICSDWTPVESTVALGESFIQTRTCTDQNNCGTEQTKPEQEHIAIGTYQSTGAGGTDCTPIYYYYDGDGDGYGYTQGSFQVTCVQPDGHVANNTDCNDDNPNINPGITEICDDNIDNDCDGIVDNPVLCQVATTTPTTTPTTTQVCSSSTLQYCTTTGDCITAGGYWYDNVCNSECQTQTFYLDSDSDSYGDATNSTTTCEQPTGYVTDNTDCNDSDPAINPAAIETCDNIDNNCNNQVDENVNCGTTSCDSVLNLTGECQNTCVDGVCQTCTPTCECIPGFLDCDSDIPGCETASSSCPTP